MASTWTDAMVPCAEKEMAPKGSTLTRLNTHAGARAVAVGEVVHVPLAMLSCAMQWQYERVLSTCGIYTIIF